MRSALEVLALVAAGVVTLVVGLAPFVFIGAFLLALLYTP